jgi:hypothetical protein
MLATVDVVITRAPPSPPKMLATGNVVITRAPPSPPKMLATGDVVITRALITPWAFNQGPHHTMGIQPAGTEGTVLAVSPGSRAVDIQFEGMPFPETVFHCRTHKLRLVTQKTTLEEEEAASTGRRPPAAPPLPKSRGRTP